MNVNTFNSYSQHWDAILAGIKQHENHVQKAKEAIESFVNPFQTGEIVLLLSEAIVH